MKKKYIALASIGACLLFSACGRDDRKRDTKYPTATPIVSGSELNCLPTPKPTPPPTPTPTPTPTPCPKCPDCPTCPKCPDQKPCPPTPPPTPCPKCPDQPPDQKPVPPDQKPVPPKPPAQNPPDQNPPDQKPGQNPPSQATYTPCPCANISNYWMDVQGQWHPYGVQVVLIGEWWMDATGVWHLFVSN